MGKIRNMRQIITAFCAVVLTGILFFSVPQARAASLCYVNVNSPGPTHNGTSWANAYTSLQSALSGCSQVWVAAGVYKPGTNRTDTFTIPPAVAVYGGFAGTNPRSASATRLRTSRSCLAILTAMIPIATAITSTKRPQILWAIIVITSSR